MSQSRGARHAGPREDISIETARRIALASQGFGEPRLSLIPEIRRLRSAIKRIHVLQLDPVAVVCRSHYLPLFARLGPYSSELLDRMSWGGDRRELFEYWGHQASLLPLSLHPFFRWRMQAAREWNWKTWKWPGSRSGWRTSLGPLMAAPWAVLSGMSRIAKESPTLVDEVFTAVTERGPLGARDFGLARPSAKRGAMWNWNDVKIALEWLFFMGKVTTAYRRGFERIYDLTERVLPPSVLDAPTPHPDDARRELVRISASAQGIATEKQLREYFLLRAEDGNSRIAELVDAGELVPTRVEGVAQLMYLWAGAKPLPAFGAGGLLSPFDSLIWDRDRTEKLFNFRYRIGIYTKVSERTHGYYVMPFLMGDRLAARVDLKADREGSSLLVNAAHGEVGISKTEVIAALSVELQLMAEWLHLDRVKALPSGNLGPSLVRVLKG